MAASSAPTASADEAVLPARVRRLLVEWASRNLQGMIIVDKTLKIIWTNNAAKDFLRDGRWLVERSNALVAAQPSAQESLGEFVLHLDGPGSCLALPCTIQNNPLIIHGRAIDLPDEERFFCLTLWPKREEERFVGLAAMYNLTRTEEKILLLLLEGLSLEKAATEQKVSVETVKSHVRQIYGKLNVTSRAELFRKALLFRVV